MRIEELYRDYSPIGDMIACILCIVLLVVITTALYYSRGRKFTLLKRSVHFIFVGAFLNILFARMCQEYIGYDWPYFLVRDAYHFCFMCCIFLFAVYVKRMLGMNGPYVKPVTYLTRFMFLACMLFDFLSPITKVGFHKEGDLWFDPMASPYNLFYLYGVSVLFGTLLFFSKRMIKQVRFSLIFTVIMVGLIMLKSGMENVNSFTSFTYTLPILVVMILLHSKPYDELTGALSADSFESFVEMAVKNKTSFDYLILKLNLNHMEKLPDELGVVLNFFWHDSFKNASLFKLEHDLFVLAIPRTPENGDTRSKVEHLIFHDFNAQYLKFQIQYKVIGMFDIDFAQSDVDIKNMINYMLLTMADNTVVLTDEDKRNKLKQLRNIRQNLIDIENKDDLDDDRVLVYCQPIINMRTGKFDTAEALMRLSLDGEIVPPYLFIPLAEYYGHIHALSRIMLNKVCKYIKKLEDEGYEFSRISINFAASEIRDDKFCDEIFGIVEANGINPRHIGIEMTESQNESDFHIVKEKMTELSERGMTIYLDDVGTGYSNLDRIVRYDIDVVKFDRFFLLEAEKNQNVVYMMKHLSEAFKELNYKILFEGVETDDHEKLCNLCGADYIQGFKYSKPLPIAQMVEFFNK